MERFETVLKVITHCSHINKDLNELGRRTRQALTLTGCLPHEGTALSIKLIRIPPFAPVTVTLKGQKLDVRMLQSR